MDDRVETRFKNNMKHLNDGDAERRSVLKEREDSLNAEFARRRQREAEYWAKVEKAPS